MSWQWKLLLLLLASYAVLGLFFGAVAGGALLLAGKGRRSGVSEARIRVAGVLTLAAAFTVNLLRGGPPHSYQYICLAAAGTLAILFACAAVSDAWLKRAVFLANPWFVAPLLAGSAWLTFESPFGRSGPLTAGSALFCIGVMVAAARFWHRRQTALGRTEWPQWRWLGILMGATAAVLVFFQWQSSAHGSGRQQASTNRKSNVLLITMDTVRADHLPLYGYARNTTPNLTEFARHATLYRHAVAAADMTLPTHASIFTGVYPDWHGATLGVPGFPFGHPLSRQRVTLADLLRESGYRTGAVVANWAYLTPALGLARGFADYDSHRPVRLASSEAPFYLSWAVRQLLDCVVSTDDFSARGLRAADINGRAIQWLSRGEDQPFFLFLNYIDAHAPYVPPAPFDAMFPGKDSRFSPWVDFKNIRRAVLAGKHRLTGAEKRHIEAEYDGGIAYMDSEIAKLLAELRSMGLYDNTLIIITSDHGEAFGEHSLMEHANGFLYEDQLHVPLLVKYPGQREAEESETLASQVDLMPTVLDVAGLPPAGGQGHTLRSPGNGHSAPVFASGRAYAYLNIYPRFRGVRRAIFKGDFELVTWSRGAPEFYDVANDPDETHNLYRADNSRAAELLKQLSAWAAAIPVRSSKPRKPGEKPELDGLKSLGYIE